MQTNVPVLIVGAGPAGLVTAIGLARHGVPSLVIERHASTSIFPRATGVSVRSMEIFRNWGIDDAVRRGGWRVIPRQATVRRLDDRHPTEVPLGFPDEAASLAVSPTTAAVCPQDHLEPVLVDLYRSLGGEVRFSTELVAFDQEPDGIRATLRDRIGGGMSVVRSSWLVGADGHRSAVRAALGIPMVGPDDLGRFMSVLFRADLSDVLGAATYGLYVIEGEGPPTVLVPSGADDRFVLGVPLPPGMDDATVEAAFPPERCVALIRAAAGRSDLPVEVLATSSFAFSAQVASRMRDGRAFLVGDAAHRVTPRGGTGMNTAVHDAHDLGWKLAWVLQHWADADLLDSFEAERRPVGLANTTRSAHPDGTRRGADAALSHDLGPRIRHAWVRPGVSTVDLPGSGYTLLTAPDGARWRSSAAALAGRAPLLVHPLDDAVAAAVGIEPGGAALLRPDGHPAASWPTSTALPAPTAALSA